MYNYFLKLYTIFRLDLRMKEFTVFGHKQTDHLPVMVKSRLDSIVDETLLDIKFEMNPIDKVTQLSIFYMINNI